MEIPNSYIINNLNDRKYKATVLSFKSQITSFVQIVVSFFLGYTMWIDLKFWFLVLACTITALLLINLLIINHHFRQNVQVQLNK